MKHSVISMICAASMTFSAVSPAYAGKSSTGGSNSTQARSIEGYRVPAPMQDPRFQSSLEVLKDFAARSPYMARTLIANIQTLNWYVVPEPLETLPQYQTGLSFNTDQTAFQAVNEVFMNQTLVEKMVQNKTQHELIIHEALMAEVLKTRGKADDVDHAHVRTMTNAILNRVGGGELNRIIQETGFTKSATDDVWSFVVIRSAPGTPNPKGNATVLARKGSRFLLYNCNSTAMEPLIESQAQSNEIVPNDFSQILQRAVKSENCALATPYLFTITQQMKNSVDSYFAQRAEKNQTYAMAATMGIIVIGLTTYAFRGHLSDGATVSKAAGEAFAASIYAFMFGLFPTAGVGFGAKALTEKMQENMQTTLRATNKDVDAIFSLEKNGDEIAAFLSHNFNKLADKGLILRSNVSAKKP